jgi:heptosyltransferase II
MLSMNKTSLLRGIDAVCVGAMVIIIGFFVRLFTRKIKDFEAMAKPKRILFIKLWAIGDSVCGLPLIDAMKKKYPDAQIDVLVNMQNRAVYQGQQIITAIILFDKPFRLLKMWNEYDLVFDLEPYLNGSALVSWYLGKIRFGFMTRKRHWLYNQGFEFNRGIHIVQNYLQMARPFGVRPKYDRLIRLQPDEKAKRKIDGMLKKLGVSKNDHLVGICASVGASVKSREWPKERFKELVLEMVRKQPTWKIILIGDELDAPRNEYIKSDRPQVFNVAGDLQLSELFCLIEQCSLFISNDTGPMHIAAAQAVKTIGLFGPNIPVLWAPYGPGNISFYHGKKVCEFSPCIRNDQGIMPDCYFKGEKYQICMKAITVKEVFAKI